MSVYPRAHSDIAYLDGVIGELLLHAALISAFACVLIFVSFQEMVPKNSKFIVVSGLHTVPAKITLSSSLEVFDVRYRDVNPTGCPYLI